MRRGLGGGGVSLIAKATHSRILCCFLSWGLLSSGSSYFFKKIGDSHQLKAIKYWKEMNEDWCREHGPLWGCQLLSVGEMTAQRCHVAILWKSSNHRRETKGQRQVPSCPAAWPGADGSPFGGDCLPRPPRAPSSPWGQGLRPEGWSRERRGSWPQPQPPLLGLRSWMVTRAPALLGVGPPGPARQACLLQEGTS